MKVVTSYFYKIRFFTPNIIPFSTAVFDPKWFHQGNGQQFIFRDKNGVVNGLRYELFMPGPTCSNLCHGTETCSKTPVTCDFLKKYREQLDTIDIDDCLTSLEKVGDKFKRLMGFEEEPVIALIVHEAPTKKCSEREVIQQWFKDNGHPIEEWDG